MQKTSKCCSHLHCHISTFTPILMSVSPVSSFLPHHRWPFSFVRYLIMLPVLLSVITRALVSGDNCFGGVETFEKIASTTFTPSSVPMTGVLLQQDNVALTRDCINLCKQQQRCNAFVLDYSSFQCSSYSEGTRRHRDHLETSKTINLYEKVCLKGISKQDFDHVCGNERLWAFERVKDSFLDGFVEKELTNMVDREECSKACLTETAFICRSADFDEVKRICRLSKENRRSQPQAFVHVKNSQRDYLENQCAPSGPASCIYTTKSNANVYSMDSLQFATSSDDCQLHCDRESSFNCRSYGFLNNRCMLSADDEKTFSKRPLTTLKGAIYGERTCVAELCTNGIFTYEKITGHVLRSAITSPVELPDYSSFGVTGWCRESCDMAQLNCPSFTVNYQNNRCERLDRNTQGRTTDLIAKEGESYFEKICLRVPQIMSQCQDKFWAFERVLGYELAPVLYVKTLNFVQSRRDCEEYCLQEREFPCRSALYNDETTECKLSPEDRRTSPGHYYRSRSMKINYLENQCVRAHSSCPYVRSADAYPTYTDIVQTNSVSSSEACEKMCNDNRHFLCRSYAYYSSNGQCFLSGDDSISAGSSFSQKRSSIVYYERQCSKLQPFNSSLTAHTAQPVTDEYDRNISLNHDNIGSYSIDPTSENTSTQSPSQAQSFGPDAGNPNKEVVIVNGTLGGIITTRVTRFPESLVPTLSPQDGGFNTKPIDSGSHIPHSNFPPTSSRDGMDPSPPNMSPYVTSPNVMRPQPSQSTTGTNGASDNSHFPYGLTPNAKCAPNARFLFEKVTSFEPIGGHLTLLYSDLQNPGIVTECAKRCEHSAMCRAFVVDYYHQSCHGLFENSSVGSLDLRLSMGKDYFEGFCVPNYVHCDKYWPFDRIIDQATMGTRPEEIVRFISRSECRSRCLEERKFKCLSASYNSFTHECHLYAEDRNSGSLSLQFNKGIDFMENQCSIDVKSCRYHAIERDVSIVSVTKSIRGTSTFHCEQACDYEKEFNCRSYTYLDSPDGNIAPGGNLCLLSADNRATSHQGSMQFRPRALYAEKDCVFQRSHPITKPFNQYPPTPTANNQMRLYPSSHISIDAQQKNNNFPEQVQINARNMGDDSSFQGLLSPLPAQNISSSYNRAPHSFVDDISQLQHIPARCNPNEYTFEKTFGYDLRYARRERAPISARPGVVSYCKEECIRRGERCLAFIIEYGPNQQQNCYFLDESASEHRNQLNKLAGTSYSEKICLREQTCGTLWTFERIIGYTFDEPAEKEINSIMLRTACQDLCLREKSFPCRSITYDYGRRVCRLFQETRRSKPTSFKATSDHVDYFDNKCAKELSTCQYRDYQERHFIFVDRISIAASLTDCQRQCDSELTFHCKSVNFDLVSRECSLSSEDSVSLRELLESPNQSGNLDSSFAQHQKESVFSEKGTCEQVSVQCNQQDMMLSLNFDSPFHGRVYTKSNPSQCFVTGNGQNQLQFAIPLNSRCGTHQESTSNYVNEVIVQQHSVIMTDSDRTIRVLCSFEISDQTITLGSAEPSNVPIAPNGIDVSTNLHGRSYSDRKMSATVVTNTAAPPSIGMRILDHTGHDAQVVSLGDDLTLRIELKDQKGSAFAMFARNLYARSSNGESLFLIDNSGCPIDASVFPELQLDPTDNRSLFSKFKAFRFPSTGVVNFEVQIRFCQEHCEPIKCAQSNGHVNSFGRRRRSVNADFHNQTSLPQLANVTTSPFTVPPNEELDFDKLNLTLQLNGDSSQDRYSQIANTTNMPLYLNLPSNSQQHSTTAHSNSSQMARGPKQNSNLTQYMRTPSNKTGFSYPSADYRYHRNQEPNQQPTNAEGFHQEWNIGVEWKDPINPSYQANIDNSYENNENLFYSNLASMVTSKSDTSLLDSSQNDLHQFEVAPNIVADSQPNSGFKPNVNHHFNNYSPNSEVENNGLNTILSNSVLPLPTSATEVPLSLAIMVDDNDEASDKMNGDIRNNEFDDQALGYDSNANLQTLNDYRYDLNYADMARLATRNDIRFANEKPTDSVDRDGLPTCSEQCNNTGLVIFLTTLIVTMVHLTLATTIYLYMNKLKQATRRKALHPNFMTSSHLNSMSPSSSSSISSLGKTDDSFSLGEDPMSANMPNNGLFTGADILASKTNGQFMHPPFPHANSQAQTSHKPHKWFGLSADGQPSGGSIRSAFNRENVFFGPKEQRFFGINNYAFPSSNTASNKPPN